MFVPGFGEWSTADTLSFTARRPAAFWFPASAEHAAERQSTDDEDDKPRGLNLLF